MGRLNVDIDDVVLEKAPTNAKYTSPTIQKEILHILANKVRKKICEEVRDAKFCILVDEAKDASNKEQMAIVLRFVDIQGFIRERFFSIVHVSDTTSSTIKKEICDVLARYNLHIFNMRGQGYDGASNMRGAWNGLQALFLRDCLMHIMYIALLTDYNCLIDMYGATITVLESMVQEGSSNSIRGEAGGCLIQKSLDILNAMDLVSTTKALLQTLRDAIFDLLLANVQFVCTKYKIDIPHMNALYKKATGRSCQQQGSVTVYQHYHYDIFNSTIDFQLEELNSRFSDGTVELLVLSSALEPKDNFKSFKVDAIYKLAEKFYPEDFNEQEMLIRLVLTLPVSTATTERTFLAMKHVKTVLRNKIEEEFLADSMMIYIERELVEDIDSDSIIDEFYSTKHRRVQL
ncbi:uncharacterized protein LOC112327991 [Populus trichocarpa]|uniref:uncharacterized protein LOC112327991 n=1 Tax=Populus trichocarpa TaxID=3694 RepID=UPI0022776EE4|nr:uncharacterized protein LOC112327991 [Populus trichocarpa]